MRGGLTAVGRPTLMMPTKKELLPADERTTNNAQHRIVAHVRPIKLTIEYLLVGNNVLRDSVWYFMDFISEDIISLGPTLQPPLSS